MSAAAETPKSVGILAALLRFGVHMEQDWPSDAAEDCGWWCDICQRHVDGDRKTGPSAEGHAPDCAITLAVCTTAARPDAALVERERIAQAIEWKADLHPCEEDARVLRSTATLIRANFSHDDAEALDTLNHRAATALHVAAIPMPAGHYSIGSRHWPGLAKMCEEAGEVQQVVGKILSVDGLFEHWDGSNLPERLVDEMADLHAAIHFVMQANRFLDIERFESRHNAKLELYRKWHREQSPS